MERLHEEAFQEDERRRKHAEHVKDYAAALPVLNEWFPGVEWTWREEGDYGYDTIVTDAHEQWPPSFKLKVFRRLIDMNEPLAGYRVIIEVGDHHTDTSPGTVGYRYFSGTEVKGPADV